MFNLIRNKKLHPFGLDISERSIKIMELGPQKTGLQPLAYSHVDVPVNLINNHVITSEEKLAALVTKAVAMAKKLESRYAVLSIPEAKSFVRMVTLPKMGLEEVDGALPWELEQDIPVPIEHVYMDWQLVEETDDHMKILAMAAPKDYIDSLVQVLKLAKITPVAFELESQATARAAVAAEDRESSVLLVDIASTVTSLAIATKGVLEYTSSIPLGGDSLTAGIAEKLGIPAKEADKMKIEFGLTAENKKGNVRQAILGVLDNIVDEIRNVVKYHEDHSLFKQPVSKVVLCGGGSRLIGAADYIAARMNVGAGQAVSRVTVCDPLVNVADQAHRTGFMSADQALDYTTAIGLALRGKQFDENN